MDELKKLQELVSGNKTYIVVASAVGVWVSSVYGSLDHVTADNLYSLLTIIGIGTLAAKANRLLGR